MCPYCYIGKRRIEGALSNSHMQKCRNWMEKLQLDANFIASENDNMAEHLAENTAKT
jgi:protein disulfide-isomerase